MNKNDAVDRYSEMISSMIQTMEQCGVSVAEIQDALENIQPPKELDAAMQVGFVWRENIKRRYITSKLAHLIPLGWAEWITQQLPEDWLPSWETVISGASPND